jgi:hypothetical protein
MSINKVDMIVRRLGMSNNMCCRDGCANVHQPGPSKKDLIDEDNNVNQDGQLEILIIPLPTLRSFIPSLATTTSDMATRSSMGMADNVKPVFITPIFFINPLLCLLF